MGSPWAPRCRGSLRWYRAVLAAVPFPGPPSERRAPAQAPVTARVAGSVRVLRPGLRAAVQPFPAPPLERVFRVSQMLQAFPALRMVRVFRASPMVQVALRMVHARRQYQREPQVARQRWKPVQSRAPWQWGKWAEAAPWARWAASAGTAPGEKAADRRKSHSRCRRESRRWRRSRPAAPEDRRPRRRSHLNRWLARPSRRVPAARRARRPLCLPAAGRRGVPPPGGAVERERVRPGQRSAPGKARSWPPARSQATWIQSASRRPARSPVPRRIARFARRALRRGPWRPFPRPS